MATEKTSLLHNNFILAEKNKVKESMVVVTIPKQITDNDEEIWSGLTRDELMTYVNDPFWCLLRKILMIVFWVALFAMFSSSVVIASVEHNGICTPKLKLINLQGIQNLQPSVGLINISLDSLSIIDKSDRTNSLAT